MNQIINEYFSIPQEGWNSHPTHSWIQFISNQVSSLDEFVNILNEGLQILEKTSNTRLDLRLTIGEDFDISYILKNFPESDLCIKQLGNTKKIIFGLNIGDRKLSNSHIELLENYVNKKIFSVLQMIRDQGGFEKYAKSVLSSSAIRGFFFENDNFSIEEVEVLWGENFGWDREDIKNFLINNIGKDKIFGLRDVDLNLIALMLIGNDYETTEWSVIKQYQGTGVIEALLICVHGLFIEKGLGENIYAHMRINRSIGPGIKSGLRVNDNYGTNNLLTNYVEIEGCLEHFLEGNLDTTLYTQELLDFIRDFRN